VPDRITQRDEETWIQFGFINQSQTQGNVRRMSIPYMSYQSTPLR
jgi:hypothetical protein